MKEKPKVEAKFDEDTRKASFECEFDKLDRGDVAYTLEWQVGNDTIRSGFNTEGKDRLMEAELGDHFGYGMKVRITYCKVRYFRGFQSWTHSRGLQFAVRQLICAVS